MLITIGACATSGGIQAIRNFNDVNEYIRQVYPNPEYIETLNKSTPIKDHVNVDYELNGCPVNKYHLIEVINAYLNERKPNIPTHCLCMECKRKGNVCVMVAQGVPCLGPVTLAGCGALCPSYNRGCYSCFGPMISPNTASLAAQFEKMSMARDDIVRYFREFNAFSEPFRKESEAYEK
jgi:coenzyme F420-reducing hydrogenase gamma subunit